MGDTASSGAVSVECETMVNGMRRKRDRAAGPVLPDDLVQYEILVRLPAKEILRCRAACRSWHRLTCDTEFLLAHHRRQPSLPLVLFHNDCTGDASVEAWDLQQTPTMRRPVLGSFNYHKYRRNLTICASCDGLLLLCLANGHFYICNPATRQWLALPALTGSNVAALYPHRPSGQYRVLYWKLPNKDTSDCAVYYVLTVGSSEGQRCIGLPVASPSMKNDTSHWFIRASELPPALLHDCLHWYSDSSLDTEIKLVVFDTVDESFRWMHSPIAGGCADFGLMDGTLGIRLVNHETMIVQVWVLQDYQMEEWYLKCRIQLPVVEMTKHVREVVSENGDMLVSGNFPRLLFHCDSKGMLVDKFQQDFVTPKVLRLYFKESLVKHVFFRRKDGSRVKLPGFFRGL